MYASQLWRNFREACMWRLRVAYDFGCKALYNLPWRASVSGHQVQCSIPTLEALLRKNTYLFFERCRKSNNVWLRALMKSDYLYSSLFFEHYNRILLCDWVPGRYSVESICNPVVQPQRRCKTFCLLSPTYVVQTVCTYALWTSCLIQTLK